MADSPTLLRRVLVSMLFCLAACGWRASEVVAPASPGLLFPVVAPTTGAQLLHRVADSDARAVLVNVWATWCVTCRREFPDLMRLRRNYSRRGLEVLFVSADFPSERPQVREFLQAQGVDFETFIKDGSDMAFIDSVHAEWSGALPATFIYDGSGRLVRWWQGGAEYDTFVERVADLLEIEEGA